MLNCLSLAPPTCARTVGHYYNILILTDLCVGLEKIIIRKTIVHFLFIFPGTGGGGISSCLHTLQRLHVNFVKMDPVVLEKRKLTDEARRTKTNAKLWKFRLPSNWMEVQMWLNLQWNTLKFKFVYIQDISIVKLLKISRNQVKIKMWYFILCFFS